MVAQGAFPTLFVWPTVPGSPAVIHDLVTRADIVLEHRKNRVKLKSDACNCELQGQIPLQITKFKCREYWYMYNDNL